MFTSSLGWQFRHEQLKEPFSNNSLYRKYPNKTQVWFKDMEGAGVRNDSEKFDT